MAIYVRYAALSDVGQVRKNNQDSGYASPRLLVVADGMGGQAAGDTASAEAVQTMRKLDADPPDDLLEALAGALHRANDRLGHLVEDDPNLDGMGTTVTALLFGDGQVGLAHIGDSRAYLLRDSELSMLTHDHTFVQTLVDEGKISPDEARNHPHRSLILKALQGRHDIEPDLSEITLNIGDRVLLCSDGLCGFVDDETISQTLANGTPDHAVVELVRTALAADSSDNITCVVADVVDNEEGLATEPMVVGAAAEISDGGPTGRTARRAAISPDEEAETSRIDPEELRYAPREPRRFPRLRRGVALVLGVAVVALGLYALYYWTQQQYYVSTAGGNVAIYRGVQLDLPVVDLNDLHEESDLSVDALPDYNQQQVVEGLEYNSLDQAREIVANLEDLAAECSTTTTSEECAGAQPTENTERTKEPSPTREPQRPKRTQGGGGGR